MGSAKKLCPYFYSHADGFSKYVHTDVDHNLSDPSQLVPLFQQLFSPQSVCDVGCGVGNFLYVFKQGGVPRVLGLDGDWVNPQLLHKYLSESEFRTVDFETKITPPETAFDLCLCLEVAEHVSEERANDFVDLLTQIADRIIFSTTLPFQGGINHVNEQKEEYWERKFASRGFKKYDIIRHQIFNNKKISGPYRRNIVVYSKNDLSRFPAVSYGAFAIQKNCMQRLYIDLMTGSLPFAALSKFLIKILAMKMGGKKLIETVKKIVQERGDIGIFKFTFLIFVLMRN